MVCNDSSSRSYLILDRFFIDLAFTFFLLLGICVWMAERPFEDSSSLTSQ